MAERNQNPFTQLGKAFKKELQTVVQQVLVKNGIKKTSQLAESVEFTDDNRSSLYMYVNEYYQFVSKGRKPRAKKVPIYALIQFIKRQNISSSTRTVNEIAFAMQRSIYLNGIKGKNFLETVQDTVLDTVEIRCADFLDDQLADSLFAAFKVA